MCFGYWKQFPIFFCEEICEMYKQISEKLSQTPPFLYFNLGPRQHWHQQHRVAADWDSCWLQPLAVWVQVWTAVSYHPVPLSVASLLCHHLHWLVYFYLTTSPLVWKGYICFIHKCSVEETVWFSKFSFCWSQRCLLSLNIISSTFYPKNCVLLDQEATPEYTLL